MQELQTHQIELEMINELLQQSRDEVEEGLHQYTDLNDFAPVSYFNLKPDGTVCRANLTGSSMLGVDRFKLINSRFGLFISEESRPAFNELLNKVFENKIKANCQVSLLIEGKELNYVRIDAKADSKDQECKMTVVDITDLKQAENAMRESEEKYRILTELSPEMIYLIDLNGCITYLNKAGSSQYRVNPSEIIGKHLADIFPPDIANRNLTAFQKVIDNKTPPYTEREIKFPFGNMWVSTRLSPVFDKEYQVVSVLGLSDEKRTKSVLTNFGA
jgi:PAS domain S-box-containing protein